MELEKRFFKNMSFEDQVRLMSTLDIVMGMHGAAFVNIMFMRHGVLLSRGAYPVLREHGRKDGLDICANLAEQGGEVGEDDFGWKE